MRECIKNCSDIFTVFGKYLKNRIYLDNGNYVLATPYSKEDYNNSIGWFNLKKTNFEFSIIIQFVALTDGKSVPISNSKIR